MNQSQTVTINLWNEHGWELDRGMLDFAMRKVAMHCLQAEKIDIYPQERIPSDAPDWKYPGRIEWIMRVFYRRGGDMTIGLLQRGIDQEFESHT